MSRLFSRLENRGQDQGGGAPSVPSTEADRPGTAPIDAGAPVPAMPYSGSAADVHDTTVSAAPTIRPLVPGYAIATSLGIAAPSAPVIARPVWPVWFWLLSLLLLLALSLLVLTLPERLLPLALQTPPAQPAAVVPVTMTPALPPATPRAEPRAGRATPAPAASPAEPAAVPPGPAAPVAPRPAAITRSGSPSVPSAAAGAVVTPPAPRAEPPVGRAAEAPAAAVLPSPAPDASGNAACSEAMRAMNLCSTSPP
jgi:hypothetical protein